MGNTKGNSSLMCHDHKRSQVAILQESAAPLLPVVKLASLCVNSEHDYQASLADMRD